MMKKISWDWPSFFAIVIAIAIVLAWGPFAHKMGWDRPAAPAPTVASTAVKTASPAPAPTLPAAAPKAALPVAPITSEPVTLHGKKVDFTFDPASGVLAAVTFRDYRTADGSKPIVIDNRSTALTGSTALEALRIRFADAPLMVRKLESVTKLGDNAVRFVRLVSCGTDSAELELSETWKVLDNDQLEGSIVWRNCGKAAMQLPAWLISGGDLQNWADLSGDPARRGYEIHTVDYCTVGDDVDNVSAEESKDKKFLAPSGTMVRWAGVANRYFAILLKGGEAYSLQLSRTAVADGKFVAAVSGSYPGKQLEPGAETAYTFRYYAGPKLPDPLRNFDEKASKVMRLGWFPIDFLAYVMLWLLNGIESFAGSYGWSIILLTLLVRTVFFPVMMKANDSMQAMQEISPEIKAIREKYKDQPMIAQQKMSELYKTKKINPVGGCLPMLIQIPVFLALYYALGSAVELRQVSFLWIRDLAQPDKICSIFGIGVHPLVLVWCGLMILQQRITPTAMDPMQAKMMMIMPILMLFFLYDLPSGLTLYWAVSQLFSLGQFFYQQRRKKRRAAAAAAAAEAESRKDRPKTIRS